MSMIPFVRLRGTTSTDQVGYASRRRSIGDQKAASEGPCVITEGARIGAAGIRKRSGYFLPPVRAEGRVMPDAPRRSNEEQKKKIIKRTDKARFVLHLPTLQKWNDMGSDASEHGLFSIDL